MLAKDGGTPFSDKDWIFEIKWDGYRAIAACNKSKTQLYSRNGLSFAAKYPLLFSALQKVSPSMVIDGEIIVLDENNKPSFQQLQHYEESKHLPLIYYVFDILYYKGKSVMNKTLMERKTLLRDVLPKSDHFLYCDHVDTDGESFFNLIQERDMEGIIAKKKSSQYAPGVRTPSWLKIKNQHTEEVVIAGYTAPRGGRKNFGALILGIYKKGKFTYVGHTGTGFNDKLLKELYATMQPLVTNESPFEEKVKVNNAVTWLKPSLVANIRFTELTKEGIMRHPVFQGLRVDKKISDMKKAATTPTKAAKKTAVKKKAAKKSAIKKTAVESSKRVTKSNETVNKTITINKVELDLSNLTKIYWPDNKYTKGDLIEYYGKIYNYITPYLKDRPQSLRRNPNGIKDEGFFQKDMRDTLPDWTESISIYSDSAHKDINYFLCNNKQSLIYLANLGCIELNPWNSRVKNLDNPDYLIMDIDPSDKNTFNDVIEIVKTLKAILDEAGIDGYCKTSGATGMHVYLPLGAKYSYDECRAFAELLAHAVVNNQPGLATIERSLQKRDKKKIYIDYLQNKRGQTLAAAYSVRPKPGATVSTPLEWKEVKGGLHPEQFTIKNIFSRLEKKGDLFKGVLGKGIDMKKALKKLESMQ